MAEMATETTKSEGKTHWPSVLIQLHIHIFLLYGSFFLLQAKLLTILFTVFLIALGLLGVTAGAHRLWAHRSYSAHISLRIFLMLCQTLGGMGTIYDWVLNHRVHHKYHGTNDDPYDYRRGFFYAHMGTRITAPNPRKAELAKEIDMSDLDNDVVVAFQKRFYWVLMPIVNFLLPLNAPIEYWGEGMLVAFMIVLLFRIPVMLHCNWLVNSARSIWGLKPKDRFFSDSNLVFLIKKSHWHKYHYTVPWDCFTGEFGTYNCGCTTAFIKIWAVMGLASGLKTIDGKSVTKALLRAIDSGNPIATCMSDVRDDSLWQQSEDNVLGLVDSSNADNL